MAIMPAAITIFVSLILHVYSHIHYCYLRKLAIWGGVLAPPPPPPPYDLKTIVSIVTISGMCILLCVLRMFQLESSRF